MYSYDMQIEEFQVNLMADFVRFLLLARLIINRAENWPMAQFGSFIVFICLYLFIAGWECDLRLLIMN